MSIVRTSSKIVKRLDLPTLEWWLSVPRLRFDRPIKRKRVEALKEEVRKGHFHTAVWALATVKSTGEKGKGNGSHTGISFYELVSSGEGLVGLNGLSPQVVIDEYEVDTEEDLATLYSTFDSPLNARNQSDINHAFAEINPSLKNATRESVDLAVRGLYFLAHRSMKGMSMEDRARLLNENEDFVLFLDDLFYKDEAKILKRGPVVSAMKATWDENKVLSKRFWRAVLLCTGADWRMGDRKLHDFLHQTVIRTNNTRRKVATRVEMFRTCLRAWEAWKTGTPVNLRVIPAKKKKTKKAA